MRDLSEKNVTEAVLAQLRGCRDTRLRELVEGMIRHLHAWVREVEPTPEEWLRAIRFLTETGQKCDEKRQEFILLSDVLGVSILVDAIANRKPPVATESSVLGPFYVEGAPERAPGADLSGGTGPRVTFTGRVEDTEGRPIGGALLDVWQTAPNGLYHVQDRTAPAFDLCGKFRADREGRYRFRTAKPVGYAIPVDGPVGRLLTALGRHPNRPAHVHFIVSAPGHQAVVTQLFTEGDSHLDSDAVFGVKSSLVVKYQEDGIGPDGGPLFRVERDFVLVPEPAGDAGAGG
jgi:protocatechuate 3,4-dioxygenase beta subunit